MENSTYEPRPVCIQGDASRFHYDCAKQVYGKEGIEFLNAHQLNVVRLKIYLEAAVRELEEEKAKPFSSNLSTASILKHLPRDHEGNFLTAIYSREWDEMVREALAHGEGVMDSCDHCGKIIEWKGTPQ